MTRHCYLALVFLLAVLPRQTQADVMPPPPPAQGPAPLLYVRFVGPEGMHVTFFQGLTPPRDVPAPVTAGLRPGYCHRVQLSGIPDLPGVTLSPTLEVLGTLCLPPHLSPADYPAPIELTARDVQQVMAGALLTKVVYLEDPEKAQPVASRADQPLIRDFPPGHDILSEARVLGRPMVVVRIGQRDVKAEEIMRQSVNETILLPGQRSLGPPRVPPCLPFSCVQLYDPFLGAKPCTEEILHDGGDCGRPAGFLPDGRVGGVDPSDTVAEYTDHCGRRHLSVSNRVCIIVPRFAVLRSPLPPAGYHLVVGPVGTEGVVERELLTLQQPPLEGLKIKQPAALLERQKPRVNLEIVSPVTLIQVKVLNAVHVYIGPWELVGTLRPLELTEVERVRMKKQVELALELVKRQGPASLEEIVGPRVVARVEGLREVSSAVETRDFTVCCHEAPHPPDKPLVLFKWADAQAAQVGDIVTFHLKYSNVGGQPMTDVAVMDSLTGRLEYVPDSAQSSRDAVFTIQENEAGSVVLRWEVSGKLLPGTSGVVTFQARVR
jgi:uncharacterized repeat protein (TIGR01451 family)